MRELALFAGAGGGILGGKLLGWRTVCAVEWDAYAASVLVARQNDASLEPFPIWDDARTFDGIPWRGRVDVVSGGFPCQAYSTAAAGKNCADDLWCEMARIVADVAPRYVFAENVARRAIDQAADDLETMGYRTRCIALAASDLGADHIRKRYWLAAYADDDSELLRPEHAEVAELPGVRARVWETGPDESRMDDGVAYRVDRISATGNGQVPCVAATAWALLMTPNGLLGPGSEARNATVLGLHDVDKQEDMISRLENEADLRRNDGASDIAGLLDEAAGCVGDLQDMVRWAYSKLHRMSYSKPEDALMLDRMKLLLEHGVSA